MCGFDMFQPLPVNFDMADTKAGADAMLRALDHMYKSPGFAEFLKSGLEAVAQCQDLPAMTCEQRAAFLDNLASANHLGGQRKFA